MCNYNNSSQSSTGKQISIKRELGNTPQQEGKPLSSKFKTATKHQQTAKKNKITRGGQGSLIKFVQKRDNSPNPPLTDDNTEH